MERRFTTWSPIDGSAYVERPYAAANDIERVLQAANAAQARARLTPLAERQAQCTALVDALLSDRDGVAEEITWQIGRPIRHSPLELRGFEERARRMIELADTALADRMLPPRAGVRRFIRPEPLGVILVLSPWRHETPIMPSRSSIAGFHASV